MALNPFASSEQLATFWKPIESTDTARAAALLELASNRLRVMATDVGIDLDTKITDNEAYETTLRWVVMESVKRAMSIPNDQPPVESWSQTAGPYSENYKYTNPSGDIWFKKTELAALGIKGKQKLNSIQTTKTDIYSEGETE